MAVSDRPGALARPSPERCSYNLAMEEATSTAAVGVRELKNNLSRFLARVADGEIIVVTERGRPVARLSPIDASTDRLADLIAAGVVRAPRAGRRPLPGRIVASGPVSDLVDGQRR